MTLAEIAQELASGLGLALRSVEESRAELEGRAARLVVSPFFGGWQVDIERPGSSRIKLFEEDVRMLLVRAEARLRALEQQGGDGPET